MAVDLAQRFGARLVGLHVRRPFEVPVFADGSFPMDDFVKAHEDGVKADEAEASAAFAKAIKGRELATEWRLADGYADGEFPVQARYADLVVVGQADPEPTATPSDLPETVALATGRPALVVPHIGAKPPGKTVLLCWNASREAARAAADALPFLKAADKVIVLAVNPTVSAEGHGAEPGADAAAWLARHGVKVTVQRDVATDADVGGGDPVARRRPRRRSDRDGHLRPFPDARDGAGRRQPDAAGQHDRPGLHVPLDGGWTDESRHSWRELPTSPSCSGQGRPSAWRGSCSSRPISASWAACCVELPVMMALAWVVCGWLADHLQVGPRLA